MTFVFPGRPCRRQKYRTILNAVSFDSAPAVVKYTPERLGYATRSNRSARRMAGGFV